MRRSGWGEVGEEESRAPLALYIGISHRPLAYVGLTMSTAIHGSWSQGNHVPRVGPAGHVCLCAPQFSTTTFLPGSTDAPPKKPSSWTAVVAGTPVQLILYPSSTTVARNTHLSFDPMESSPGPANVPPMHPSDIQKTDTYMDPRPFLGIARDRYSGYRDFELARLHPSRRAGSGERRSKTLAPNLDCHTTPLENPA